MTEVACIVVCRNLGDTLEAAVGSVLAQTREVSEILVVDDGSDDPGTLAVLERVEGPRVAVVRREHGGVAAARNFGVAATRSPYVLLLDADDLLDRSYVEKAAARLDVRPDLAFVSSAYRAFGDASYLWEPPSCDLMEQLGGGSIHVSTLFRRELHEAVGGFDESLSTLEDWAFWLAVLDRGYRGEVLPEPLLRYRVRAGSRYHRGLHAETYARTMQTILGRHTGLVEAHAAELLAAKDVARSVQRGHENHLRSRRTELERLLDGVNREIAELESRLHELGAEAVDWGDLRSLAPKSPEWGLDRGKPLDRHFIERFLRRCRGDVRGRVLEVKDGGYTRWFGEDRVECSDVVDVDAQNPKATVVADLTDARALASDHYDCFILTQTLHILYDFEAALREAYRVLAPGGVLLCTLPALSRISDEDCGSQPSDFWRFTEASVRRSFGDVFPPDRVEVEVSGNVQTCVAFLHGLGPGDLDPEELERQDPEHPLLFCVRARKPSGQAAPRRSVSAQAGGSGAILMYHRVTDHAADPRNLSVPPREFAAQLAYLRANFSVLELADLVRMARAGQVPERSVAITFDDGFRDALDVASPLLCQYGLPATFFVNSACLDLASETFEDRLAQPFFEPRGDAPLPAALELRVGEEQLELATGSREERERAFQRLFECCWRLDTAARSALLVDLEAWAGIRGGPRETHRLLRLGELVELARRPGHTIGSHTLHHLSLPHHAADVQRREILGDRERLERALGRPVELFAYPYGACDAISRRCVDEAGFLAAVGVKPGALRPESDRLELPRVEVRRGPLEVFVDVLDATLRPWRSAA